ncbi:helix-turn-helix domain-containing protein [Streptomyces sp. NPDC005813]|uniref:helix-turn-helix domain-containing protein n=1 Tax=Streptomyces sp. NPDC005813 TaxID=3155592 RepID=UPI003410CEF4
MTTPYAHPSLARIVDLLGTSAARLLAAPAGCDNPVTGHSILDVTEEEGAAHQGTILLAVGMRPDAATLLDALPALGRAGAAAIALKTRGADTGPLVDAAGAAGVAVLAVADVIPWRHVDALLAAAVGNSGQDAPGFPSAAAVGDLFALANAVAATVGGAITVEDPQQRVLAYSNLPGQPIDDARRDTILGRQVPLDDHYMRIYRRLWRAPGAIRIGDASPLARLAVAVRAGSELLGSIWAVESGTPFSPEAEQALTEAAGVAALHLLRLRRATELERRARGELLRSLLAGRTPSAARFGIESGRMTVLALELPSSSGTPADVLGLQVVDLVTACAETLTSSASCVVEGQVVYALLPLPEEVPQARVVSLAETVITRSEESLHTRLRAGIGSAVADFADVPRSRQEADRVLAVLAAEPHRAHVASIEDVRCQAILLELDETIADNPRIRLASVTAMLNHDAERGTRYAETLLAYLDAFGDTTVAADRLHIHQNTFRYRIRRVGELFDVDLGDADERLVLWLQLRLTVAEGRAAPTDAGRLHVVGPHQVPGRD